VVKRSRRRPRSVSQTAFGFLFKKKDPGDLGRSVIDAPGKITGQTIERPRRRRARWGPGSYLGQAHHRGDRRAGRASSPVSSRTRSWCGPISRAMNPDKMPKSLLVIGSGAIGVEFASFSTGTLGAEVTIVEGVAQILPVEDAEIRGLRAPKPSSRAGHQDHDGHEVVSLDRQADSVTATIDDGRAARANLPSTVSFGGRRRRQCRESGAGKAFGVKDPTAAPSW